MPRKKNSLVNALQLGNGNEPKVLLQFLREERHQDIDYAVRWTEQRPQLRSVLRHCLDEICREERVQMMLVPVLLGDAATVGSPPPMEMVRFSEGPSVEKMRAITSLPEPIQIRLFPGLVPAHRLEGLEDASAVYELVRTLRDTTEEEFSKSLLAFFEHISPRVPVVRLGEKRYSWFVWPILVSWPNDFRLDLKSEDFLSILAHAEHLGVLNHEVVQETQAKLAGLVSSSLGGVHREVSTWGFIPPWLAPLAILQMSMSLLRGAAPPEN